MTSSCVDVSLDRVQGHGDRKVFLSGTSKIYFRRHHSHIHAVVVSPNYAVTVTDIAMYTASKIEYQNIAAA